MQPNKKKKFTGKVKVKKEKKKNYLKVNGENSAPNAEGRRKHVSLKGAET